MKEVAKEKMERFTRLGKVSTPPRMVGTRYTVTLM